MGWIRCLELGLISHMHSCFISVHSHLGNERFVLKEDRLWVILMLFVIFVISVLCTVNKISNNV